MRSHVPTRMQIAEEGGRTRVVAGRRCLATTRGAPSFDARTHWGTSPASESTAPLAGHSPTTPVAGTVNKPNFQPGSSTLSAARCRLLTSHPKLSLPRSRPRPSQIKNPSSPAPQPTSPRAPTTSPSAEAARRSSLLEASNGGFWKFRGSTLRRRARDAAARVPVGLPVSRAGGLKRWIHNESLFCLNFGNSRHGLAPEHGFQLLGSTVWFDSSHVLNCCAKFSKVLGGNRK